MGFKGVERRIKTWNDPNDNGWNSSGDLPVVYGQTLPTSELAAGIDDQQVLDSIDEYLAWFEEKIKAEAAGKPVPTNLSPTQNLTQNVQPLVEHVYPGAGLAPNPAAGSYPPNPTPMQGPGDNPDRPVAMPKTQVDPSPEATQTLQVTNPEAVHDRNDPIYQTGMQPQEAAPDRPSDWMDLTVPTSVLMQNKPGWYPDKPPKVEAQSPSPLNIDMQGRNIVENPEAHVPTEEGGPGSGPQGGQFDPEQYQEIHNVGFNDTQARQIQRLSISTGMPISELARQGFIVMPVMEERSVQHPDMYANPIDPKRTEEETRSLYPSLNTKALILAAKIIAKGGPGSGQYVHQKGTHTDHKAEPYKSALSGRTQCRTCGDALYPPDHPLAKGGPGSGRHKEGDKVTVNDKGHRRHGQTGVVERVENAPFAPDGQSYMVRFPNGKQSMTSYSLRPA